MRKRQISQLLRASHLRSGLARPKPYGFGRGHIGRRRLSDRISAARGGKTMVGVRRTPGLRQSG